jgi:hypothetical protein
MLKLKIFSFLCGNIESIKQIYKFYNEYIFVFKSLYFSVHTYGCRATTCAFVKSKIVYEHILALFIYLFLLTGLCIFSYGDSQQPFPPTPLNQCVREVQQLSASCFQRSGLQMMTIDAVLTNGTIAPLPANANIMDLRKTLCG